MARIAIIGDVHLGKGTNIGAPGIGGQYNSRILDQIHLLDWILLESYNRNVTDIILTGDITEDNKPDYYLIDEFCKWIGRCRECSIDVHVIMGNHDLKRSGVSLSSPLDLVNSTDVPNAVFYKTPTSLRIGDLFVTLLPFTDRRMHGDSNHDAVLQLKYILEQESEGIMPGDKSVVIGHLALEGSIPFGDEFDDSLNELMCPLSIFDKYNEVWMGHVHKFQILTEEPLRAHIGSLDLSDFGETTEKKYCIIIDKFSTDKILLPTRPLRRIQLVAQSGENSTEKLLTAISALHNETNLTASILKIEVKLLGAEVISVNKKEILQQLENFNIYHLSSFQESRTLTSVPQDATKVDADVDPKEAIKIWCDLKEFKNSERELFLKFCQETIREGSE